jgi:predicted RNA-binding protein with PUA-like domain
MAGPTGRWLVKTEPSVYSWADLVRDGRTEWTGVRNFEARNHLRAMRRGDLVLVYHSGGEKQVVGVARVSRGPEPDPTARGQDWSSVELAPVRALAHPVPLDRLKKDARLRTLPIVTRGRLSVAPVRPAQFTRVLELAAG